MEANEGQQFKETGDPVGACVVRRTNEETVTESKCWLTEFRTGSGNNWLDSMANLQRPLLSTSRNDSALPVRGKGEHLGLFRTGWIQ
jgi:hypothetical protein